MQSSHLQLHCLTLSALLSFKPKLTISSSLFSPSASSTPQIIQSLHLSVFLKTLFHGSYHPSFQAICHDRPRKCSNFFLIFHVRLLPHNLGDILLNAFQPSSTFLVAANLFQQPFKSSLE